MMAVGGSISMECVCSSLTESMCVPWLSVHLTEINAFSVCVTDITVKDNENMDPVV